MDYMCTFGREVSMPVQSEGQLDMATGPAWCTERGEAAKRTCTYCGRIHAKPISGCQPCASHAEMHDQICSIR